MTVEYRTGDLFDQHDAAALGHGVNCFGKMGSGIAPLFKKRWYDMYRAYKKQCETGALTLGKVFPWTTPEGLVIYNLATQYKPGRNGDLQAIHTCLTKAVAHAHERGLDSIAIPRIGAGIAGLDWADVRRTIEEVAATTPVRIIVVSLPGADS